MRARKPEMRIFMTNRTLCLFALLACACGDTRVTSAPDVYIEAPGAIEFIEGSENNRETLTVEIAAAMCSRCGTLG